VLQAQRERILRAAIASAAELGYPAMTVTDVVRRARVSRSSFYAQFADREDCFFAATAEGRRLMFGRISDAVHAAGDGGETGDAAGGDDVAVLRAGLGAYLRFLRDEPAFATVFYLELPAAGRRGGDRLAEGQAKLAARTAVWHGRARNGRHPDWPEVPATVFRALTGATEELVRDKVRAGSVDELPALEDVIVALHLRLLTAGRW
jgi:AcrR family transcriptional regulator